MNKICLIGFLTCSVVMFDANAGKAIEHSVKASKHSVLAVSNGVGSVALVASAVVSVPVIVVGSAIAHSGQVVSGAIDHHHHHHQALEITEITITVDPAPNRAIKNDVESDKAIEGVEK